MSSASFELNYQKPYPKKKGKNRHRLFTSSIKREVEYLGSVHTYLDIFESETFSFRVQLPSTRIRWIRTFLNPVSRVKIFNTLWICSGTDAKSGYFLSGDATRSSPVRYRERQRKTKISNLVSGTTPNWTLQPNTQNTVRGKNRREHITKSVMWKGLVQHRQIFETLPQYGRHCTTSTSGEYTCTEASWNNCDKD